MSGVYFLRFLKVIFLVLLFEKLYLSLFYLSIYIMTSKVQKITYQLQQFAIRPQKKIFRTISYSVKIRK
jgi:hypothetical protein